MNVKLTGEKQFYQFIGAYDHQIELTLYPEKELDTIGHVVVLPWYSDKWLFTVHKERGIEWPGGKVEQGERPLAAALRELYEETGGYASSIWLVGYYKVFESQRHTFTKNIYVAKISGVDPVPLADDVERVEFLPLDFDPSEKGYSPLVQDQVFHFVRKEVFPSLRGVAFD
ncbi:NUDIX domain-containing protein [Caldalkalibacillus mannanilyticus]|uniref:NUDIX domain-containing protein n=1 Tax=Caldalkalibacillus mannanilyticus TaxID=1418 RepID=UPI0004681BEB|nr:NUDIX domain-containing protein [Caldalkalibacillus mannanilyticus]